MTPALTLTLTTPAQLLALPQRLSLGQPPFRLDLALPGLSETERSAAQARLSVLLSACGCNEGALALILALVPSAFVAFTIFADLSGWQSAGLFLALLVAASLAGKFVGLTRARTRLQREVQDLLSRLDSGDLAQFRTAA